MRVPEKIKDPGLCDRPLNMRVLGVAHCDFILHGAEIGSLSARYPRFCF